MKRIIAAVLVVGLLIASSFAAAPPCRPDGNTGLQLSLSGSQSGDQLVFLVASLSSTNLSARFDGCPCESCDGITVICGAVENSNQVYGSALAGSTIYAASPGSYTIGLKIKTTSAPFYGSKPQKIVYRYRIDVPAWTGTSQNAGVTFLGFDCE